MEKEYLIKKWLDNALSPEELQAFKKLEAYGDYVRMDEEARKETPPAYDTQAEYARLRNNLLTHSQNPKSNPFFAILKVAVVVVLVVAAYFTFFAHSPTTYETQLAEKTNFTLPDGSKVTLNVDSRITYDEDSWSDNRSLHLDGEAYFKVEKGSRFQVITDQGTVTVLGTQFNVKERRDYFQVQCFEGLVSVDAKNNTYRLPAGENLEAITSTSGDTKVTRGRIVKQSPGWVASRSEFKDVPYEQVLDELSRQYDVKIVLENVDTDTLFTGNLVHDDLKLALESITLPLNLSYTIKAGIVTLRPL